MYLDKEEQRVGSVEQDEWVKVTVGRADSRWRHEGPFCPWHIAFEEAGLPVYQDRCSVGAMSVDWTTTDEGSLIPLRMKFWIWANDLGKNPAPISVWVNRRTLEIRDE